MATRTNASAVASRARANRAQLIVRDSGAVVAVCCTNPTVRERLDQLSILMTKRACYLALKRNRAGFWLQFIARNSSFTYKGQAIEVKQVGRELGVRYVLEIRMPQKRAIADQRGIPADDRWPSAWTFDSNSTSDALVSPSALRIASERQRLVLGAPDPAQPHAVAARSGQPQQLRLGSAARRPLGTG
jgi:hypothetical protein